MAGPDTIVNTPIVNAKGLQCPLPVLRARKALLALKPGGEIVLHATDPAAWEDVPAFCGEAGHTLLRRDRQHGVLVFLIRREH